MKKIYNLGKNFKERCWLLPNGHYVVMARGVRPLNLGAEPVDILPRDVHHLEMIEGGEYVAIPRSKPKAPPAK